MKSFQDRLLHDFDVRKEMRRNGKGIRNAYVYIGEYAIWGIDREMFGRYRRIYLGLIGANVLIFLICSLQNVQMNTSHLVGFFTLLSMVALIFEAIGVVEFSMTKERMYLRDCKNIRDIILWSSMIHFIVLVGTVISGIIYLSQSVFDVRSLFVIFGFLLSAFASLLLWIFQNKLSFTKLGRQTLK